MELGKKRSRRDFRRKGATFSGSIDHIATAEAFDKHVVTEAPASLIEPTMSRRDEHRQMQHEVFTYGIRERRTTQFVSST